jgi:2,4-dienoyl-CoA reductase-like NADH-dependent reductase (Old Yellow Enzyme family)
MRSATWEALSDDDGRPFPSLLDHILSLSQGSVGLIVPGAVFCSKTNKHLFGQTGLSNHDHATLWRPTITKVHSHGSKLIFQLIHGGAESNPDWNGGFPPMVPTALRSGQHELTNSEIGDVIQQFVNSALLAQETSADGIQIHAAHGYLLSHFLSPAFNQRTDKWGGSPENRLRIIQEIITETRKVVSEQFSLSIKLNSCDFVPGGVTPDLAASYVKMLEGKLDFFEISGGLEAKYVIRSKVIDKVLCLGIPKEKQAQLIREAHQRVDGLTFSEAYFRPELKIIRKVNPKANLALVGGNRTFAVMEEIVKSGDADLISMSRPFLNDQYLVERFRMNTLDKVNCINCGSCVLHFVGEDGNMCHLKKL